MDIPHSWLFSDSTSEAKEVQRIMAERVILEDSFQSCPTLGGMDVSNNLYDPKQMIYASAVVLSDSLLVKEQAAVAQKQSFPYISGLLGFREAPALVEAFKKLKNQPSILLVDGHGIAHPRGLGIASHLGVLLDIPTIGVAKSILVGEPAASLALEAGSQVPLVWKNKTLGVLLRTRVRSNPLIISCGHRVSLRTAVELVQGCLRGYRLPEATRQAHLYGARLGFAIFNHAAFSSKTRV
jgi:deoxyribonuclease V